MVPDDWTPAGDRSLHLPRSAFLAQLEALEDTHLIVSLDDAASPPRDRPCAAITFDDAYLGCIEIALPELARRGWPATLFVPPGRLGTGFWWDGLAGRHGLDDPSRALALEEFAGAESAVRQWAAAEGREMAPADRWLTAATEAQLRDVAGCPGLTFGSHTWSHRNLTVLSSADVEQELTEAARWLEERFTNYTAWLAYPYGFWNRSVEEAARAAGYRGALDLSADWVRPGTSRFTRPRLNVPAGLSAPGFELRVAGLVRR